MQSNYYFTEEISLAFLSNEIILKLEIPELPRFAYYEKINYTFIYSRTGLHHNSL